jgi:energy-coupling factor transport system permease protein
VSVTGSLYVDDDGLLHRLDPRATLALVTALFVVSYVFGAPSVVGLALGASLALLVAGGGTTNLYRLRAIVVALFGFGLVVWPAFVPAGGPVLVDAGPVRLTLREFRVALGRSMRIATFVVGGLVFVSTTSNEEIVRGMRQLGLPYAFCFAVGTALRLFPTFLGAAGTVRQAQEARGLELSASNPIERLRRFVPLLVPVFMTAFRGVRTQSMALEARGFDTRSERSFYGASPFDRADWAVTAVAAATVVAAVALSLLGYGTVA